MAREYSEMAFEYSAALNATFPSSFSAVARTTFASVAIAQRSDLCAKACSAQPPTPAREHSTEAATLPLRATATAAAARQELWRRQSALNEHGSGAAGAQPMCC
jgi:hypothetical protein